MLARPELRNDKFRETDSIGKSGPLSGPLLIATRLVTLYFFLIALRVRRPLLGTNNFPIITIITYIMHQVNVI